MGRTRGCLWLVAGIIVAVMAGLVAFIALRNAATAPAETGAGTSGPPVQVVVVTQSVPVGTRLTADMLQVREVPVDLAAPDSVALVDNAVGKVTLANLYPGEIVLFPKLADPTIISGDGRVALVVTEEEDTVLMAFPARDLMSQIDVLKAGDHVDLLFSLEFPTNRITGDQTSDEEQATFTLLQNLTIASIIYNQAAAGGATNQPLAILFTVDPQDALTLKYMIDAGGSMDVVLRAPGVERPFDVTPVDVDYLIDRYRIPIEPGR